MSNKVHSHRHRHHHDKPQSPSTAVSKLHPVSNSGELLFTIDRKGDIQNSRYGGIDKYKVPKYRTTGYGRLLGLDRRFRIISRSDTERLVDDEALDPSSKNPKFPSALRNHAGENASFVLKPSILQQDDLAEQQDFVALGRKRRRLSKEDDGTEQSSISVQLPLGVLKSLQSNNNPASDSGSSSSDELEVRYGQTDPDAFETFKNHPDNKKNIELRRLTEQDPQNVQAWLDLVEHQEQYFKLSTEDTRKAFTASQRRTVTEMRTSLYEKAIPMILDAQSREKLVLGLMREGTKIWDTNQQMKQWKAVLTTTNTIDLWYEFLNFQQTNAVAFSYESCLETFLDVWKFALSLKDDSRDYHCVYVISRLTTFVFEAGFPERAIGIWQALMEYNFFPPTGYTKSSVSIEVFWESEYPRIGEEGAKGWASSAENEIPSRSDQPLPDPSTTFSFVGWATEELQRSARDFMPARTLHETIEDDPFRMILFSDVKDFVFKIQSEGGMRLLLEACLKFCGLPSLHGASELCSNWWTDPFLFDFSAGAAFGAVTDTSILFAPAKSPLSVWQTTVARATVLHDLASRILKQLVDIRKDDDHLAVYAIAHRLNSDLTSARKLAKALLKQRSNNLLLYNAYALVEVRNDKTDVADNVWSTALSMSESLGPSAQRHKIVLWDSWTSELISQQKLGHALNLLVEAVPEESVSSKTLLNASTTHETQPSQRLRTEAYFRDQMSRALGNSEQDTVTELTSLYARFKYLNHKSTRDITSALEIYASTLSLPLTTQVAQRIHQSRAALLHHHAVSSPSGYRPKLLVDVLSHSTAAFPGNSILTGLLETYLRGAGIVDRVRILARTSTTSPTNNTVKLASTLQRELRATSNQELSTTTHSTRHAFVTATSADSSTRHCPAIWTCWLTWEIAQGDKKRIRDTWFQALGACPWVKELYLLGFGQGMVMAGKQGEERVWRSMAERGLRVRWDVEEYVERS